MRNRSILTGSYLRPSPSNGPLPRLKPQPAHISCMIHKRRKAREARLERGAQIAEWRKYLKGEAHFELALEDKARKDGASSSMVYPKHLNDWSALTSFYVPRPNTNDNVVAPLANMYTGLLKTYQLDEARSRLGFPPEMLKAIKQARRDKIQNKTRELERERRGEILRRTIRRRNKGPPAHRIATMTKEERRMDKAARSVSEVGYVGMVKRKLGWKLRDPEAWKKEDGSPQDKPRLDRMLEELRAENERRRMSHSEAK